MISVNFSGKQLAQPDLINQINQVLLILAWTHSLKLEITEMVIDNTEFATAMLSQLRA